MQGGEMKKFFIYFIVVSLFGFYIQTTTAADGKISGFIFDKITMKPIPDANVIILKSKLGAASQDGGYYFIDNINEGIYDITVRVIGYDIITRKEIHITENTNLNFFLTPKAIEFDPIFVTATLYDHRQSQVSVSSDVLTLSRLKEQTANTVAEAMESLGGLYLKRYDGFAGTLTPSIRGANADQVVVLLDGMRLNTAQGGGVDLNIFPISVLERIEVVRGGHSALMGSDAIGGAIQLVSKEFTAPKGFSYGINTTFGSFGTQAFTVYGSHKIGLLSYFLNYNRTQSDGDFTYKAPDTGKKKTRENNDFHGNNVFLKTKLDLGTKSKLHIMFHVLQSKKGIAGSVDINPWTQLPMTTPNARAKMKRRLLCLNSENQITDRLRFEGQVFYQSYDFHYTDPDGWSPTDDLHENSASGLNLQGQMHINKNINLIGMAEIRQDELESTKFKTKKRTMQSLIAQTEIRYPIPFFGIKTHWTLIPAIRWDTYSDVNAQPSPKLGALISTGEDLGISIRGNIGESFRVPTFDDLYWPDEGWGKGNPDLIPETSSDFDLGLVLSKKSSSFVQAELSYFNHEIKNLISWGPGPDGVVWMPLNIGKARTRGIETSIKYRLPQNIAYLNIFHTWMKAIDQTPNSLTNGKRLIYRPDSKLDILAGTKIGSLMLNLNYRIVSKLFTTTDNSKEKELPGYKLLNGNIGYSLLIGGLNIDLKLQMLNLFDKSIYLNDGFPLPGREFRFGLGVTF